MFLTEYTNPVKRTGDARRGRIAENLSLSSQGNEMKGGNGRVVGLARSMHSGHLRLLPSDTCLCLSGVCGVAILSQPDLHILLEEKCLKFRKS